MKPLEQIEEERQLIVRVLRHQAGIRLREPGVERPDVGQALGDGPDDHPAPIFAVVLAKHEARALQPVEHARDRPGGEPRARDQLTRGHRAGLGQALQAAQVRHMDAQPIGHGLVQEHRVRAHARPDLLQPGHELLALR